MHEHSAETEIEGHAADAFLIAFDRNFAGDFDSLVAAGFALDGALGDAHQAKQTMAVDGLVEEEICAGVECFGERGAVVFTSDDYDGGAAVHAGGAHLTGEFDAAGARHVHVEKDGLKLFFGEARRGFFAFGECDRVHFHGSENFFDEFAD